MAEEKLKVTPRKVMRVKKGGLYVDGKLVENKTPSVKQEATKNAKQS